MDDERRRLQEEARAHLAKTVEGLARQQGLSLDDLAARSKVDGETIHRVLQGEVEADLDLIYRLAGALEIEPRRLFDGIAWVPGESGGRLEVDPDGD